MLRLTHPPSHRSSLCLYQELVRRPIVFSELAPGREMLLGQMEQQLEVLREDFETRIGQARGSKQTTGRNLPEVVTQVVLAQQLQDKAAEMLSAADSLLHDLQGMSRFRSKAQELHQYLSDSKQQHFSDWVDEVEGELQDEGSGLAMQITGRLMEVNKDDLSLQVNYSDRLVRFLREVRQLVALGFKMPQAVQWNADIAHKFYRHGVVLKQVANFYNTIDTQIVRSQKPLLLDYALQFEQLATNPRYIPNAHRTSLNVSYRCVWRHLSVMHLRLQGPEDIRQGIQREDDYLERPEPARGVRAAAAHCSGTAHPGEPKAAAGEFSPQSDHAPLPAPGKYPGSFQEISRKYPGSVQEV